MLVNNSEFRKEEVEQSIPDRFERIVRQFPDRIAIKTGDRDLTYAEINATANRLARAILAKQMKREEPVMLLFEHGPEAVTAILGALKAGTCYVPLDPSLPRGRVESISKDSGIRLIVTNKKNFTFANDLTSKSADVLDVDALETHISNENLGLALSPDAYACIMYTSGSTGEPKGVLQNHRGIMHKVMVYTNLLHICADDRLTLLHYTSFDACMHHLFGSLLNGASLLPFDPRVGAGSPLASWLNNAQVSIYHSVPTVFREMAAALTGEEEFPHLRAINLSGAPMHREDVELYKRLFSSECILLHMIGATETGWIRHYLINKDTEITDRGVPVGYSIQDKEVVLLRDDGQATDAGEVGEIAVKSRYLSQGYWRRPELTASKFLPHPAGGKEKVYLTGDLGRISSDGCLFHLGRKDFQVKIRGFRIEVGEVESALLALEDVREAVVVKTEAAGSDDERLVAYIVARRQPVPTVTKLRRTLGQRLPDYMVPTAFVFLEALPLTPNGKVDRKALPLPGKFRPELDTAFVAPRTPLEEELAEIWAEVLCQDQVGIHDNFFDLGGDSISAIRVISRILEKFQLALSVHSFFPATTVEQMSSVISQSQGKNLNKEDLEHVLTELESLSDEDAERILAHRSETDSTKEPNG